MDLGPLPTSVALLVRVPSVIHVPYRNLVSLQEHVGAGSDHQLSLLNTSPSHHATLSYSSAHTVGHLAAPAALVCDCQFCRIYPSHMSQNRTEK
jgi:hypothetical protein